jgi:hypothetical protein
VVTGLCDLVVAAMSPHRCSVRDAECQGRLPVPGRTLAFSFVGFILDVMKTSASIGTSVQLQAGKVPFIRSSSLSNFAP